MKKLVSILVAIGFLMTAMVPLAGADGRGHHRWYGHSRHHASYHHRVYYDSSGDLFWAGLGFGVLTGAIVSNLYYNPPPPPTVVYTDPQTVIVSQPPPVVVVPAQRFGAAAPATYGQVMVMAAELNMHSGPGSNRGITGTVRKGAVLDVIESAPNWFYVRTPSGRYGWVMDRYTQPAQPVG